MFGQVTIMTAWWARPSTAASSRTCWTSWAAVWTMCPTPRPARFRLSRVWRPCRGLWCTGTRWAPSPRPPQSGHSTRVRNMISSSVRSHIGFPFKPNSTRFFFQRTSQLQDIWPHSLAPLDTSPCHGKNTKLYWNVLANTFCSVSRSVMPSVPPPIENNDSHDNSDLLM